MNGSPAHCGGKRYKGLPKHGNGLVERYISKITGLGRAQVTRLVSRYAETGAVKPKPGRRRGFSSHYTKTGIELLAVVDEAHETLSGPATRKILHRAYHDFADLSLHGIPKAAGAVVNGWQLSVVYTGGSGAPYDVTYSYVNNGRV